MKILLDTHIALWALYDVKQLSEKAKQIISNPNNTIYYSSVSSWEVLLKHERKSKGNLPDVVTFLKDCKRAGYESLGLNDHHVAAVNSLMLQRESPEHKDPFDKLLLAQAKSDNFYFLTHDSKMVYYDEACVIIV